MKSKIRYYHFKCNEPGCETVLMSTVPKHASIWYNPVLDKVYCTEHFVEAAMTSRGLELYPRWTLQ